jgi:hypothetical protein
MSIDPEYKAKIMQDLYKRIRNTNWEDNIPTSRSTRGRKPKKNNRPEATPRTRAEELAAKQKYNWL